MCRVPFGLGHRLGLQMYVWGTNSLASCLNERMDGKPWLLLSSLIMSLMPSHSSASTTAYDG